MGIALAPTDYQVPIDRIASQHVPELSLFRFDYLQERSRLVVQFSGLVSSGRADVGNVALLVVDGVGTFARGGVTSPHFEGTRTSFLIGQATVSVRRIVVTRRRASEHVLIDCWSGFGWISAEGRKATALILEFSTRLRQDGGWECADLLSGRPVDPGRPFPQLLE